jgi:hypothetical protein
MQIKPAPNRNRLTLPQAFTVSSSWWRAHTQFEGKKVKSGTRMNKNSLINRASSRRFDQTAHNWRDLIILAGGPSGGFTDAKFQIY